MVYTKTAKNIKARSVPNISLCNSNDHGGHNFMSLNTGKTIHGYKCHELPMGDEVIKRIK